MVVVISCYIFTDSFLVTLMPHTDTLLHWFNTAPIIVTSPFTQSDLYLTVPFTPNPETPQDPIGRTARR